MTIKLRSILIAALALGTTAFFAGCDDPASDTDSGVARTDAGPPGDSGPPVDGGPLADGGPGVDGGGADGGGGTDAGMMGGCGTARPDVSGIRGTEGVVIARDGTIYYSQRGAVGRLTPGGSPENAWARVGGTTVWGLALNAANTTLYVGVPGTGVRAVDIASGMATTAASGGSPNGLTMGPDDALYYGDFSGGHVYRLAAGEMPTQVTTSTISQVNGVVFMPDGTLLAASYATGDIHRLTLTAGAETGRTTFASLGRSASPDGLALDADGNVYVGDQGGGGRLTRLAPDGTSPMNLVTGVGGIANIEFGAGVLDCEDIYITSGGAMQRYEMGDIAGAAVPWH